MPHTERFIKDVYQQQEIPNAILKCNINKMFNLRTNFSKAVILLDALQMLGNIFYNGN